MSMHSSNLLPALQELPGGESGQPRSFREIITGLVNADRAMFAAEFASAVSAGMWFIFDDRSVMGINISGTGINEDDAVHEAIIGWRDTLIEAHDKAFPSEARTLAEHWQEVVTLPKETLDRVFMSPFKGKIAELETNRLLESNGWTDMTLAPPSNHPVWDNIGIDPDGKVAIIQVKTGETYSAGDVQDWIAEDHPNLYEQVYADVQKWTADPAIMEKHPELAPIAERLADGPDSFVSDRYFALGNEIISKSTASEVDTAGRIVADIGPDFELLEGTTDGLNTLSDNLGVDVPDGVVDIIPYATAIVAGARLVYSVLKTEKEFEAADRTTKNKIQVVQTLTLMSRMGITTVLATAGGMGGGTIGSVVPGVGNLIGGIVGSISGAGIGMYLNNHLQPYMLNLALDITGLTNDDLFYYKNKPRIDTVALSFQNAVKELAAAPA